MTPAASRLLATRRAERKARAELTIADLMDAINKLSQEVAAIKRMVNEERRSNVYSALSRHYRQTTGML